MKILVTRFPLESRYGGAEVQTLSLMQGLKSRGHDVEFLGSCPTLLRLCAEHGIPFAKLEIGPPPVTKWAAVSFWWRRKTMQKRLITEVQKLPATRYPLHAIVMLSLSEKLLLTPFALEKGLRIIWLEHDRVSRWLAKNPWLPQLRRLSTQVTTVVVSELSRKIYLELGWDASHLVVIPNGIDEKRLTNTRVLEYSSTGRMKVGTLVRLTADKGVDILIQAIADVPQASLTIIGDGPEEGYLRTLMGEMTQREGLTKPRVHIQHHVEDLAAFYRSLDIFILPSREHDPFGLVAAEAMLCGIPVIVTDACGIAGYLHHSEDAWIVPANDARALKQALETLQNPELRKRLAVSGERLARETFSLERMMDAYEKLLR